MSVLNAEAGAVSFAHLAGITAPIHAAKADAPEKDDKDAKKAEDDSDDEKMESDEPEKDDDKKDEAKKAESDEPDEDDEKDDKKDAKKAEYKRGFAAANTRMSAVLASRGFARNPALGAHLLVNSTMSASAILATLRDAPAASGADAGRSARNPNLGTSAPAVAPTTDARWGAAFKRAGVV